MGAERQRRHLPTASPVQSCRTRWRRRRPSRTSATLVTFTPGARTNWHTHKTRQVLVATQGTGMGQVKDKPPRILHAGDVAEVPPGLVHWHGAVAGHLSAHISFVETNGPDNTS
ncbi:cupin domain-containing protein [Siccirubricoccus deserti]